MCQIHIIEYFLGHSIFIACCIILISVQILAVSADRRAASAPEHSGQFSFMLLYLTIFQRYAIYRQSVARQTVNRTEFDGKQFWNSDF